ncbi:MAG: hypothetical protein LBT19_00505 [Candidatus Nomurabacteria bacterium]|jgi:uncharacterized membrane protein|nr:hypothetical protein [Candidatus Nomurabacteria bacterium]
MENQVNNGAPAHGGAGKIDAKTIEAGKGMAIFAYIIALIPYFAEKNNKYVRYHAVQGMNILLICIGWSIVAGILSSILAGVFIGGCYSWLVTGSAGMCNPSLYGIISFVLWVPSIVIGVCDIIGLVNAASGKMKAVPIFGKIKIIKK